MNPDDFLKRLERVIEKFDGVVDAVSGVTDSAKSLAVDSGSEFISSMFEPWLVAAGSFERTFSSLRNYRDWARGAFKDFRWDSGDFVVPGQRVIAKVSYRAAGGELEVPARTVGVVILFPFSGQVIIEWECGVVTEDTFGDVFKRHVDILR